MFHSGSVVFSACAGGGAVVSRFQGTDLHVVENSFDTLGARDSESEAKGGDSGNAGYFGVGA